MTTVEAPGGESLVVELRPAKTEAFTTAGYAPEWAARWVWHWLRHRGLHEVIVRKRVSGAPLFRTTAQDLAWSVLVEATLPEAAEAEARTIESIRAGSFVL